MSENCVASSKFERNLPSSDNQGQTRMSNFSKWWHKQNYDLDGSNGEAVIEIVGFFSILAILAGMAINVQIKAKQKDHEPKIEIRESSNTQQNTTKTSETPKGITCSLPKTFIMTKQKGSMNS